MSDERNDQVDDAAGRYDEEVSIDDILQTCNAPGQSGVLESKLERERFIDNVSDNVDANKDAAPALPPKVKHYFGGLTPGQSGGEALMEGLAHSYGDEEISIHDLKNDSVGLTEFSSSVKAFFGDEIDASTEEKPSFEYNMKHGQRGCFIILNHMNFKKRLQMNPRNGTDRDRRNLEKTAERLGFDYIRSFNDLTYSEILNVVHKMAMADHSNYDCFAMAILSHGEERDILYAQDRTYHVDELTEPFMSKNCPTLAGKPKMFFIQACRGTNLDEGSSIVTPVANKSDKEIVVIPNAADFLLAFSTVPGYYAWRNQSDGSWFIQALCKCLNEFGDKLELMQIMTRVNRMVAYDFTSYSKQNAYFHGKKQIPSIVTRLTSEVYFRKKSPQFLPSGRKKPQVSNYGTQRTDGKSPSDLRSSYASLTDDARETNL